MKDKVKYRYKPHSIWRTQHKMLPTGEKLEFSRPSVRLACMRPGCSRQQWSDALRWLDYEGPFAPGDGSFLGDNFPR